MGKCSKTNKAGEPCRSTSVGADGLCAYHGGRVKAPTLEHAQAGARARADRIKERGLGVQERLARLAEEKAQKIAAAYVAGLDSHDERVRFAAAEALLTRVFGRPTERIETTEKTPLGRLTNLSEAELRKLRAELEQSNVIPLPRQADTGTG